MWFEKDNLFIQTKLAVRRRFCKLQSCDAMRLGVCGAVGINRRAQVPSAAPTHALVGTPHGFTGVTKKAPRSGSPGRLGFTPKEVEGNIHFAKQRECRLPLVGFS